MNTSMITILAFIAAIIAGAALALLLKKNDQPNTTETATDLLKSIQADNGFAARLYQYVQIAVRAVEQMADTGAIAGEGAEKKQAAIQYIDKFAEADGENLTPKDMDVAGVMVEAAVAELPKKDKTRKGYEGKHSAKGWRNDEMDGDKE